MDLGLISSNVSADRLGKVTTIADLDFSRVKARMNVDCPTAPENMERFEREVKRFLALVVLEGGYYVVSERVDALWHYFVLHTQEYRDFCAKVYGSFLHHVPILPEEKARWGADYLRTKETYAKHFGAPPADLWGEHDLICWGGCAEVVESRVQN